MSDLEKKANDLYSKYKAEEDEAASDDELLEEWRAATRALRLKAPRYAGDDLRAPGNPLAETSKAYDVEDVRKGYNGDVYGMKVGSALDTAPAPGGKPDEADGLRWLESPLSAMQRDLERVPKDSREYKRVQELYGPARIAYHRKNNLDINTGKPK